MTTVLTLKAAQLALSPWNVRTNSEDANATHALEESIAAHGLLQPIQIHPLEPSQMSKNALAEIDPDASAGAAWGVYAGGRRLRAIRKLIADGRIPADYWIDCVERDLTPAETNELSLAENLLRRNLRPYEVHAAIAHAQNQGSSIDDIAEHLGQRPMWVRQQLRLGQLHPAVFAAYVDGKLGIEQACAYGATEDCDLQAAAYENFKDQASYNHSVRAIRAFLKVGDREAVRLLSYVGEDQYRAAGGSFELDLFADGADDGVRGRVTDDALLRTLSQAKLLEEQDAIRMACDWRDLAFVAAPPQLHGVADWLLEIHPDCESTLSFAARENQKISLPLADGPLRNPYPGIIATLDIVEDGHTNLRFFWPSRAVKDAAEKAGSTASAHLANAPHLDHDAATSGNHALTSEHSAKQARADIKDAHGLTADGVQIMRSIRREMLRAMLVDDARAFGELGKNWLIFSQLRMALNVDSEATLGARRIFNQSYGTDVEPQLIVMPFVKETDAHVLWNDAVEELLAADFITTADPVAAFTLFLAADEVERNLAAAAVAGLALLRSLDAPGWQVPVHDALATNAQSGFARQYLGIISADWINLFSTRQRLEMAQPFITTETLKIYSALKGPQLSARVSDVLNGIGDCIMSQISAARMWCHPLLSFTPKESPELAAAVDPDANHPDAVEWEPERACAVSGGEENERACAVSRETENQPA